LTIHFWLVCADRYRVEYGCLYSCIECTCTVSLWRETSHTCREASVVATQHSYKHHVSCDRGKCPEHWTFGGCRATDCYSQRHYHTLSFLHAVTCCGYLYVLHFFTWTEHSALVTVHNAMVLGILSRSQSDCSGYSVSCWHRIVYVISDWDATSSFSLRCSVPNLVYGWLLFNSSFFFLRYSLFILIYLVLVYVHLCTCTCSSFLSFVYRYREDRWTFPCSAFPHISTLFSNDSYRVVSITLVRPHHVISSISLSITLVRLHQYQLAFDTDHYIILQHQYQLAFDTDHNILQQHQYQLAFDTGYNIIL
jgi:hypothetical protein